MSEPLIIKDARDREVMRVNSDLLSGDEQALLSKLQEAISLRYYMEKTLCPCCGQNAKTQRALDRIAEYNRSLT